MANFFTGWLAQGIGSGTSFTEATATGHGRVACQMLALSYGTTALNAGVTFPVCSAAMTVTQRGLYDAASGGNLIMFWNLKQPPSLTASQNDTLADGTLNHFFPDLASYSAATALQWVAGAQIGLTSDNGPIYSGVALAFGGGVIQASSNAGLGGGGSGITSASGGVTLVGTSLVGSSAVNGPYPNKLKVPANWSRWMNFGISNGTTGIGGTSRIPFVAPYAMHDLVVDFYNINENNGETTANQTYGLIFRAVLEYPAGTFYFLTVNGRGSPYAAEEALYLNILQKVTTDPVGVSIPAGATFWVRTYLQVPYAPTLTSVATSTTGGALAAATYYYVVEAVCGSGKIRSPSSSSLNVTTTGTTSSNTLTITAALSADAGGAPVAYNIYRSTFSAGTTNLFTTIPAGAGVTTWIDAGLTQPVAPTQAPNPATNATYPTGPCTMIYPVTAGPTPPVAICNYKEFTGGTGVNALLTANVTATITASNSGTGVTFTTASTSGLAIGMYSAALNAYVQSFVANTSVTLTSSVTWTNTAYSFNGPTWGATGASGNVSMWGPCDVRGTPTQGLDVPVVLTVGDSIVSGTGDIYDRGYVHGTLVSNSIAYFNKAKLGEYATQWNAPYAPQRIQISAGVSDIIEEVNTNDLNIFGTPALPAVAGQSALAYNDILRWCEFRARGPAGSIFPRIWRATIIPRVTTTDSLESYTNQEPGGLPIAGATNATPIACTFGTYLGSVGSPPVTTAATVSITSTNSGTGTTFTTASTTGLVNGMWCAALSAYVASFVANTSVTLNTSVTFTAIAYTFGGAASGQTTVAVSSASGIGLISTSAATVGGQAFQAGGATYVVTSISGTTVTFSPALAANIIAGQSLVFGTTSPAGASIGATSVTVGYSGYQTSYDTYWNATNMVFVGQQFALAAPANTTASGAVAVGATSLIVASATGIATGQGFQFYGAAYTVTSVSGTTVNFSPALTAAISNGAPLTFGVYTVTGVNYATNAVSFTPALLTAISAGGYINFQSQIVIRNGAGNTAVNGTFYPACNLPGAATFSLYSDYLYQSPVSGNGTYTASSAMLERPWTEAQRQVYNAWVRAGCPMLFTQTTPGPWVASNYTPVAPGTTGAITDTSPLHPLFGTFDAAGAVEYNSTGVLTVGASYWQTSASPFVYSIDGVHPTQASYAALSATVPVSKITAP